MRPHAKDSNRALFWEHHVDQAVVVPSVIIAEEDNVIINPAHADAKRLVATKIRRFEYDARV